MVSSCGDQRRCAVGHAGGDGLHGSTEITARRMKLMESCACGYWSSY